MASDAGFATSNCSLYNRWAFGALSKFPWVLQSEERETLSIGVIYSAKASPGKDKHRPEKAIRAFVRFAQKGDGCRTPRRCVSASMTVTGTYAAQRAWKFCDKK